MCACVRCVPKGWKGKGTECTSRAKSGARASHEICTPNTKRWSRRRTEHDHFKPSAAVAGVSVTLSRSKNARHTRMKLIEIGGVIMTSTRPMSTVAASSTDASERKYLQAVGSRSLDEESGRAYVCTQFRTRERAWAHVRGHV